MPNIIGDPIPSYVKNQIKQRQSTKGSGISTDRTPQQISALNSPTSWVKLASGVNVDGNRLQKNQLPSSYSGASLAQNHVLFGGFSKLSGNQLVQRNSFLETYGPGDNQFGLTPMAGIESISVKHLNNGSIRSAEVKIKAYNKTQFSILDILYMRLGYTMLLEWGNSNYINNSGGYESMGPTLIETGFFSTFSSKSPTEILVDISKKRQQTVGNYDAIYGRISNFNWSFSEDGSYDITLELISIGDIIESLRIDVTPDKKMIDFITEYQAKVTPPPTEEVTPPITPPEVTPPVTPPELEENQKSEQEKEASPIKNRLLAHLFIQKLFHKQATTPPSTETTPPTPPTTPEQSDSSVNNHTIKYILDKDPIGIGDFVKPTGSLSIGTGNVSFTEITPFNFQFNEVTLDITLDNTNQSNFDVVYFEYSNGEEPTSAIPNDNGYYIRLGYLLKYIQNYIVPRVDKGTSKNPPLINIDYGDWSNLMYYFPNQISLDPRVCVVRSQLEKITLFNTMYDWVSKNGYAYPMHIYVSFSQIQQLMSDNTDEEGKVNLFSFLSSMCNSLNVALGGVNNLQPIVDEDSNTIKIIDSSYTRTQVKDYSLLIYGYNKNESTITRNFDLKTGITSDYAYLITVGSTEKGYTNGSENTMFSKWNNGIIDRYKAELVSKQDSTTDNNPAKNYIDNFYAKGKLALGYKYSGDATAPELDNNAIDKNISIASEFYKYAQSKIHQKRKNYASPSQGFMSLSLGLTLDGLAGFRIGDSINVDTRIFPANYPATLRFIIKSISHKLSGQDWETTLDTVVVTENFKPDGTPWLSFSDFQGEVKALLNGIGSVALDKTTGNVNIPSWYSEWKTLFNTPPSVAPTLGAGGPAIIIGDSQSPAIAQYTTKAKLLGDGKTQGPSTLWKVGGFLVNSANKDLSILDFLKAYGTDTSVKYVVINIGTNGGFSNTDAQVKEFVSEVKKHFPSATLLGVQGSWAWGGNKSITDAQVKAYYDKFRNEGVTVLEPPIGNHTTDHPNALTKRKDGQLIFKLIGEAIDAAIGG